MHEIGTDGHFLVPSKRLAKLRLADVQSARQFIEAQGIRYIIGKIRLDILLDFDIGKPSTIGLRRLAPEQEID